MSMEVISTRSALLSNYEVLALLRELESDQLVRQKTALRIKKEEEEGQRNALNGAGSNSSQRNGGSANEPLHAHLIPEEVSENLRTVEFEAIQYLTANYQPTKDQTPESIASLGRALNAYKLTKAEKLQIVNLVPTEPVELYVIIEEIEDRLGDQMDSILNLVRNTMAKTAVTAASPSFAPDRTTAPPGATARNGVGTGSYLVEESRSGWENGEGEGEGEMPEKFDDLGAGAGVEGDLEMEDDGDL